MTDARLDEDIAGVGGYHSDGKWFQAEIKISEVFPDIVPPDINWFELSAIVLAMYLWCDEWENNSVHVLADNMPALIQLRKQSTTARRRDILELVLEAADLSLEYKFKYWTDHLPGVENKIADGLSRGLEVTTLGGEVRLVQHATPCLGKWLRMCEAYKSHPRQRVNELNNNNNNN